MDIGHSRMYGELKREIEGRRFVRRSALAAIVAVAIILAVIIINLIK